ncbi:T9SS type A sorting domain-containing protein [Aquirufa antheringensis]|uniref:T9SS type A sorting domain-containing protein n=1 Tax=Aquirufa antheringensis TaxID=2516559 RepID=UPI0022A80E81|nr:T9SS type A sorting domain-containing protein [Aquirufa antheringensis]MCZ2477732.1 T9SS type A sorting domain-containing protein [Aquirufa antheringensis]
MRILLFTLLSTVCLAQTSPIKISTLSSGIGSSTYLQSIGQSAVVLGTASAGSGYIMRQGFLQPSSRSLRRSVEPVSIISLDVFPNPFTSQLRLKLSRSSASVSQVELYSIDGLRVWSAEIAANLSEVQLLDFDRLRTGKYILRLVSGNQVITKQLVKE